MSEHFTYRRRTFLAGSIAVGSGLFSGLPPLVADEPTPDLSTSRSKICAFVKYIQALSYDRLAEVVANLGFDGIEATVRNGGHVLPERVEEDLPKLVEALNKHGLEITVMASSINRANQSNTEKVLRTASQLGITCYRMDYYRYDLNRPLKKQLAQIKPVLKDLIEMNREFGMRAVYQNHSGSQFVGAPVWDIHSLLQNYPVSDIGIAFDIQHATIEGGLAWPLNFQLAKPQLGAVYFKDFLWEGRRIKGVPLGEGQIDRRFVQSLKATGFAGPLSLHVEYLGHAGVEENIAALKQDLGTLRQWLA